MVHREMLHPIFQGLEPPRDADHEGVKVHLDNSGSSSSQRDFICKLIFSH